MTFFKFVYLFNDQYYYEIILRSDLGCWCMGTYFEVLYCRGSTGTSEKAFEDLDSSNDFSEIYSI